MSSPVPWDDARAILTAWGLAAGVEIRWPNEPFTVPAGLYASFGMVGDMLEPIELGPAGAWSESGFLEVTLHVPTGHGTRPARVHAKDVANLFRGRASGPVTYHRGSLGDGAPDDNDSAWWCLPVVIDYRYTDTVA